MVGASPVQQHAEQIRSSGLTVLREVLSPDFVTAAREIVDRENALVPEADGARYFVNLTARSPIFRELVTQSPYLPLAESLLGDDCILSGTCARTAMPGCAPQRLHRDQWDWWPSMPWLPEIVAITLVWPLDDFTAENGATRAILGTHVERAPKVDDRDEPVLASVGSCIAFDQRILHRGGANRTSLPRRALFVTYLRSWMKPHTDHRRSTDPSIIAGASPTLLRLLGFMRQSSIDAIDGGPRVVEAPGASDFYGVVHGAPSGRGGRR